MNETNYINILQLLFILAEQQGQKIAIDKTDGKIYRIAKQSDKMLELAPLSGGASVVHFSKQNIITADNVQNLAAFKQCLTSKEQTTTRQEPAAEQNWSGLRAEKQPAAEQEPTDTEASFEEVLIGKGKVNLQPFAQNYSGEIKVICEKIEKVCNRIFKNTDKKETILKTIADYNNAKKLAHAAKLFELRLLLEKLQARQGRQQAADTTRTTIERKEELKRKLKIFVCVAVSVSVLVCYFYIANRPSSPTPQTQQSTVFEKTLQKWQKENGVKIYPYGEKCLRRACQGITSEKEIYNIIEKNVKK